MRFVITSGGTAGHIYPAQAVALQLQKLGHEVVFAGSPEGMEARLVPDVGIKYVAFDAKGFDRSKPLSLISSSALIAKSTGKAKDWLRSYQPDAIAAFGGYVSVPVGRAGEKLKIPLLVHEQNSAPGWANKYLAPHAQALALTYNDAWVAMKPGARTLVKVTGNPVRQEFIDLLEPENLAKARADFREQLQIPSDALVLLVFGGSQGARHINTAVVALADQLLERPSLHVVQITGPKEYDSVKATLRDSGRDAWGRSPSVPKNGTPGAGPQVSRWDLIDYCKQMPGAYAAADLIVSRAGASSLAELATIGTPMVLVPYPFATNNHQESNARSLVEAGAAAMVLDKQLDSDAFANTLFELLDNSEKRTRMANAASLLKHVNATEEVCNLLLQIAD